ncbi:MAG TPA: exodeoxyribonuclease VII large subunit [Gemmatimonadales bacterium]|nr:exodeoxyribonuclease VII large subunit [Gemmatimonadales bacterium]
MTLQLPIPAATPADEVLSVGDLTAMVKGLIEGQMGPLWVRGEIVQCRVWSSGHWYFTLRDAGAQVRCCMWRAHAARAGRPPADGTEVFAYGAPGMYEAKGEFQLVVTRMIPTSTVGEQQRALERTRMALAADGLFDRARKRPVPPLAGAAAVVTSLDGAALRDIITVTRKRWPGAALVVVGSRVQGDGAADELVAALGIVNRLDDIDLCIVGRGGGARDDLAAFNDERVCRALAAVCVPTISAVGHEIDVTLADLVADVRAATPSAAAELAWADAREVTRQVADLSARMSAGLDRRTRFAAERLARTGDRLQAAAEQALERQRYRVDRLAAQLDALSPLRVLARGYAVPLGADGRVLRRRAEFTPARPFRLRVADGDVAARAE